MVTVFRYQAEGGREPVTEWLQGLRDKKSQSGDIEVAKECWANWKLRQV